MQYKLINTALLLNGKLIPEGSTIELSESETEGIKNYLHPLEVKPMNNKKEKIK